MPERECLIFCMSLFCSRDKVNQNCNTMCKLSAENRRESTKVRDEEIRNMYKSILYGLGELAGVVSKTYIYERIRERTKLSVRTISFILNHTR